jgi:hypothetical protein
MTECSVGNTKVNQININQKKQNTMLDIMEGIEEYNNAGALFGFDAAEDEEAIGALDKMNPLARMKAKRRMFPSIIPSRGSRAEMEKFFGELPPHINGGMKRGELRLADTTLYSIKKVASKTIKMFETQDTKAIGLNSLSGAKLPKNQAFLVSGITVLAGVPADLTADKIMATSYGKIEDYPAIASGEFNLKANKKAILPESSMLMFKTAGFSQVPVGYYKLANPRLIHDDIFIEATFELGTMEGLDPKTHIFLGLHGTITTP